MAAEPASLSASDHAALADGFRPLEAVHPDLPNRLLRYVTEGADEDVLASLQSMPETIQPLGLELIDNSDRHPPYGKQVDAMTLCGKAHSDCVRDQAEREKCAGDCA